MKNCSLIKTITFDKSIATMAKLYQIHFKLLPHQLHSLDLLPVKCYKTEVIVFLLKDKPFDRCVMKIHALER